MRERGTERKRVDQIRQYTCARCRKMTRYLAVSCTRILRIYAYVFYSNSVRKKKRIEKKV